MFFDGWFGLLRVLVVGTLLFVCLIVILRFSGKRTLSKWNAFDFIVTIALGSTLSAALLTSDISLIEGLVALLLLISLQFAITWLSIRVPAIARAVKASPTLLVERGMMCRRSMRHNRVTESEVFAAIRTSGVGSMDDVRMLVLETDGSFSVITAEKAGDLTAASDVEVSTYTGRQAGSR